MTKDEFKKAHLAGGLKLPPKDAQLPPLKFGKLDVPKAVDNRCYCTAIEDQGARPWCAAYTAAAFAENVIWRKTGRIRQIETEPIYKWAKAHDGDPEGDGTTLNAVLEALLDAKVFGKECAVRRVGGALFGLAVDVDDVKAAVHRFGCFLGGFNITDEWYSRVGQGVINGAPGQEQGGHAVLVCGYDENGVWIENSWGAEWGLDGFGFVTWPAFRKQFMYGTVLTHCLDGFV